MSPKKAETDKDKREHQRLDVQIWAVEISDNSRYFHLLTNLSMGGFFIEKELPFPVGSIVDLELDLDGEILPIRGKIVNNYKNPITNKPGAGVKFVEMDEKVKARIEGYLKNL